MAMKSKYKMDLKSKHEMEMMKVRGVVHRRGGEMGCKLKERWKARRGLR
jgi:hypothetical protein